MPNAVVARQRFGPETYTVADTATGANQVVGGRLVEFDATETGKVVLAATDTDGFLGVALYDAHPDQSGEGTSASGYPDFDFSTVQPEVPVAWTGVFLLQFVGTANPGDLVYPAASGQVKTAVGTATRAVGMVVQATAVANNGTGYVRLF
jgi:hypothetical protein